MSPALLVLSSTYTQSMAQLFLASFLGGLLLGVFAMLAGVERPRRRMGPTVSGPFVSRETLVAASSNLSARFHVPLVAAFATAFGATGYLLARYTALAGGAELAIASLAGAVAAAVAILFIAAWALPSARRDIPDERYLFQGLIAHVTDTIHGETGGCIAIEVNGTLHAVRALSLNGDPIEVGAEVVIERIEGDTAFVERWSHVEQRL
jgi:membrane protein implicated in regulation of membrane protease activity